MRGVVAFVRRNADGRREVPDGCPSCGGSLLLEDGVPPGERPVRCGCGAEVAVLALAPDRVRVRLPYGADAWQDVASSNLAAAGTRGADLLVRFAKGGVYRYPGAAGAFQDLLGAGSKGAYFQRVVRPLPTARVCARYGCLGEPGEHEVLCGRCLERASVP